MINIEWYSYINEALWGLQYFLKEDKAFETPIFQNSALTYPILASEINAFSQQNSKLQFHSGLYNACISYPKGISTVPAML